MKFTQLIIAMVALIAAVVMAAPIETPAEPSAAQASDDRNNSDKWQRLGSLIRYLVAIPKNRDHRPFWGKAEYTTLFPSEIEKYNQWYSRYTRTHGQNGQPTAPIDAVATTTDVTVISATPVTPTPPPAPAPSSSSPSSPEAPLVPAIPAPEIPASHSADANSGQAYTTYGTAELETMVFPSA